MTDIVLDKKALEAAVDALRDLEIKFNPPAGTSIRQATVAEAQRLVRDRLASLPQQTAEPVAIKEAVALSLDGLPPVQIENLHFFKDSGRPPFDAPAIKAMARELLAYRKICHSPLYTHPASPPVGGALGEFLTRVDTQVLTAASEMNAEQRAQPEWLWHVDQEAVTVTYGRWAKLNTQAPYIRADLVLSALASSERSGREAVIAEVTSIIEAKVGEVDKRMRGADHRAQEVMNYAVERLKEVHAALRNLAGTKTNG